MEYFCQAQSSNTNSLIPEDAKFKTHQTTVFKYHTRKERKVFEKHLKRQMNQIQEMTCAAVHARERVHERECNDPKYN